MTEAGDQLLAAMQQAEQELADRRSEAEALRDRCVATGLELVEALTAVRLAAAHASAKAEIYAAYQAQHKEKP